MAFPELVALASRNPGKIREIRTICADWPVRWVTAEDEANVRPWPEVKETGETYADNALAKARAVADALGTPALADDSGIEVDALGGGPGPQSARFAGPDASEEQNLAKLIGAMAGVPSEQRAARYRCVAVLVWPVDSEMLAEGECEGTLIAEPRGTGGFGYDPIFVPAGFERTMAELSPQEKDRISHRGKALRALGRILAGEPVTGWRT
jgi:XTP/dITP diphosphohydrolase